MIEHPTPSDAFTFAADLTSDIKVTVVIEGPGLSMIDLVEGTPLENEEGAAMPDPIAAFARAVNLGLLPAADPSRPAVVNVTDTQVDLQKKTITWEMDVSNVDPGAARILANMLVARELNWIAIVSDPAGEEINPSTLAYPAAPAALSFPVDYQPSQRRTRERFMEITLAAPPEPDTLNTLYEMLEAWTTLALLGGYSPDEKSPIECGAYPEPGILTEPVILRQDFDLVFIAHEAAFIPPLHYFARNTSVAVQQITIR